LLTLNPDADKTAQENQKVIYKCVLEFNLAIREASFLSTSLYLIYRVYGSGQTGQPGTTQIGCLVNPTIIVIMKTAWKFICGKNGMTRYVHILSPISAKQQQINNISF
jgi:hypothetical protein